MIIYGTRGRESTIEQGAFNCPRCGMNRTYQHIQVKRWFTLYFIPIFPIGTVGDYVQCDSCSGTFGAEVKSAMPPVAAGYISGAPGMMAGGMGANMGPQPMAPGLMASSVMAPAAIAQSRAPTAAAVSREQLLDMSRRIFVLTLSALQQPNQGHMDTLCSEYQRISGAPLSPDQVNHEWQQVVYSGEQVGVFAQRVGPIFTPQQSVAVVQVVARIIAGGRSVSAADRHLANSIAQSLGLSPAIADQTIVSVLGR